MTSIVSLVDSENRVYLGKRRPRIRATSSGDEEDEVDIEQAAADQFGLDLGMEPLRRIVSEIQRLNEDVGHYNVDSKSARKAGLLPYGDYLQGSLAGTPLRPPSRLAASKARYRENPKGKKDNIAKGQGRPASAKRIASAAWR